jgi:chemotaxis protein CheD
VNIVVNVADAQYSGDPQDSLVTHALGSCIGVMLYDTLSRVAGMLHFQLPAASGHADRASKNPAMFADTGMVYLLELMQQQGARLNRMNVKIAGGAEMLNDAKSFNIGRRNHAAIRKILWQRGLLISGEDVGGKQPRTVHMDVCDGSVTVKSNGEVKSL